MGQRWGIDEEPQVPWWVWVIAGVLVAVSITLAIVAEVRS
jgi:hypothetical protein